MVLIENIGINNSLKDNSMDALPIKSIKYLNDETGGYYLIEGEDFRDLFDDELNPIN